MAKFLTSPVPIEQIKHDKYKLLGNTLFEDKDGSIYLAWRGYITDNFTWIRSNDWDIRCSHIHDIGCQFRQIIKVNISKKELINKGLLYTKQNKTYCKDIPIKYLDVINISGNWINNLFYRMLKHCDNPPTPKIIQYIYRAGVCFNIGWFLKKEKIDINNIY